MGHARGRRHRGASDAISLTAVRRPPYGQLMPSNDDPRWELPVWDPSAKDLSPWKQGPAAPRPGPRPSPQPARRPAESAVRRAPPARVSPLAVPFVWWADHPWVVVWALVVLAPGAALFLHLIDDSDLAVTPSLLTWVMVVLFVVALALAMMVSAVRSLARTTLGTVGALVVLGLLLWPVTTVTLGRTHCPRRAGSDLGVGVAAGVLDAWRTGAGGDGRGAADGSATAWAERTRGSTLVDYQRTGSGCWDRVAPVDVTRTWHEFRVTLQDPEGTALSKTVVVHTTVDAGAWKISEIEGPLP